MRSFTYLKYKSQTMTGLIISLVFLITSTISIFILDYVTKEWQKEHQKDILEYKKEFGPKNTLYPKYHTLVGRIIVITFFISGLCSMIFFVLSFI